VNESYDCYSARLPLDQALESMPSAMARVQRGPRSDCPKQVLSWGHVASGLLIPGDSTLRITCTSRTLLRLTCERRECDRETGVLNELVTAEGDLVRTDPVHEPELFWGLCGAGGNLGVMTALEFAVHPVGELYSGAMFFALEQTADVLHAWTELLPTLAEEITSWACVLHFPPRREIPVPVHGRSFAVVMAAFLGAEADGRELLRPLRRLCPEIDTFAIRPPVALSELAMDPRHPLPYRSAHALLDDLPVAAIADLVRIAGAESALAMVQLRHTGGALARHPPGAGARTTLPGQICMFGLGVVRDAGAERPCWRSSRPCRPRSHRTVSAIIRTSSSGRRTRVPSSTPTPGRACAASRPSTTRRTSSRATTTSRRPTGLSQPINRRRTLRATNMRQPRSQLASTPRLHTTVLPTSRAVAGARRA